MHLDNRDKDEANYSGKGDIKIEKVSLKDFNSTDKKSKNHISDH